jgi:ketosteroid isomerase-like protein
MHAKQAAANRELKRGCYFCALPAQLFASLSPLDVDELSVTAGADVAFCHALIYCANAAPDGLNWKLAVRVTIGLRKIDGRSIVVHEHHSVPTRFSSDRATVCHS